ncbi:MULTISPECIES: TetR/AcrR family transcriptional regulator [Actinomadura]|uniref:TetR family transcriptional regulator n=1 Tax=Actinomadura litoris TaxID=2678616 RepID=A0A7K1KXR3_9ACTN|nr:MULTISPECIES: TetR/AcrR family transcriptional regulator [Actinomadura]MBT2210881.1 TetR/AcrR family transcriptional regulator [Actinomadura sp. NEAU-AAG7]MUN36775.1 TetR family transcriptional regulator [Actinomadura litoris]
MTGNTENGDARGDSKGGARKRDRAATRAELLAAARERFRLGYDGTSVRDIAKDVGVDPALVYRYFGSKLALFEEACVDQEQFTTLLDGPPEQIPIGLLRSIVFEDWSQFTGDHPLVALLRSSAYEEVRGRLHDRVCDEYFLKLNELVNGPDAELRVEILVGALLGMGAMRSIVRSPALQAANAEDVMPYFVRLFELLLGREAADAAAPS